jgi:hypothetical protein
MPSGRPSTLTPERAAHLRILWHASPPVTVGHMARVLAVAPCTIYEWAHRLGLGDRRRFARQPEPQPRYRRCEHCAGVVSATVPHRCQGVV